MRLPSSLALGIALALGAPAPASADRLSAARAAKDRVDYDRAHLEVDRAIAAGDMALEETRLALALRGEVLAVLERTGEAEETFAELLAIDPEAKIDPGLAPRVLSAFGAAAGRPRSPVTVSCRIDQGQVQVELEAGTSKRARLVRVERAAPGARATRDQVEPPAAITLPRSPVEVACFAVDDRGNVLAAGAPLSWSPPGGSDPVSGQPLDDRGARPMWRNPWLWAGAAVVVAGTGATFNYLARRDQDRLDEIIADSDMYHLAEAEEVLERGRSRTRWARGLYVGAGVLAAAAVTFALLPRRRAARPATTTASLAVGPGHFLLVLEY
jgi:hypothetical protein